MTSETQLKNERVRLFYKYKVLAEQMERIGAILQTTHNSTSYKDYMKAFNLKVQLTKELDQLWVKTSQFIYEYNEDRWKENGEIE